MIRINPTQMRMQLLLCNLYTRCNLGSHCDRNKNPISPQDTDFVFLSAVIIFVSYRKFEDHKKCNNFNVTASLWLGNGFSTVKTEK